MALIRQVLQHPESLKWAYVETSDEDGRHCIILGKKEFDTEEEAKMWSEGFALDSYEWKDPKGYGEPLKVLVDGNAIRPPLGIMPKKLWLENRLLELKAAIKGYMDVNLCVPTEWNEEYNSLIEQLNNEYNKA